MSASYETVRLDLADAVATLTLDRSDRMNALTPHLFAEAGAAIEAAVAAGARALVITGEERAFCSGADLSAGAMRCPTIWARCSRRITILSSRQSPIFRSRW